MQTHFAQVLSQRDGMKMSFMSILSLLPPSAVSANPYKIYHGDTMQQ